MSVKIFVCYAHEDELLLKKFRTHIKPLQRQGLIKIWHDRDISAGTEWREEIDKNLNDADLILLLISSYFIASDYCYSVELKQALERHERKEILVIPVILRYVDWQGSPFSTLQALPKDSKPVTSRAWRNADEAFSDVAQGIRKAISPLRNTSMPGIPDMITTQSTSTGSDSNENEMTLAGPLLITQEDLEASKTISDSRYDDTVPMLGRPVVRIIEGKETEKVYSIDDSLSIGRHKTNDIFLQDSAVSRFHASIFRGDDGRCVIKDLNSTNGIKVNYQIIKNSTYVLQDGDKIQIGYTNLIFNIS